MDDSMVTSDEVIKSFDEEIKTIPTNFNEKEVTCKTRFLYFTCLSVITITWLIAVSIYCYVIKHQTKHLLPFDSIKN